MSCPSECPLYQTCRYPKTAYKYYTDNNYFLKYYERKNKNA